MGKDDAFGANGKTVIRPGPAGEFRREPFGDPPTDAARPQPHRAPAQKTVIVGPAVPSGVFGAQRGTSDGYGVGNGTPRAPSTDWSATGRQAPPARLGLDRRAEAQPSRIVERIPLQLALGALSDEGVASRNPITAAAARLLILFGRLRLMIVHMEARPLMAHVADEIEAMEKRLLAAGVSPEEARIARYALCATADDIVQNVTGKDAHLWTQFSMLAQFFGRRDSGVGFFEELDRLRKNPAVHYDLLELMHACLSLGFEGQYPQRTRRRW